MSGRADDIDAAPTGAVPEYWPPFRHVVAEIVLAIGWTKVAAKIRRYGWREGAENLVGRVDRMLSWRGHVQPQYRDAFERKRRAHAVLTHLHNVAVERSRTIGTVLASIGGGGDVDFVHPTIADDRAIGATPHRVGSWKVDSAIEPAFDVFMVGVDSIEGAIHVVETKCAELWYAAGPTGPVRLCVGGTTADAVITTALVAAPAHRLTLFELSERLGAVLAEMQRKLEALEASGVLVHYDDPSGTTRWWTLRPTAVGG